MIALYKENLKEEHGKSLRNVGALWYVDEDTIMEVE